MTPIRFRISTYNIHKCIGMDRKLSPTRIAEVIAETNSDIVALQEVVRTDDPRRGADQIQRIASEIGFPYCCFGKNRVHWKGAYGNAVLSRFRISGSRNHDITISGREPRGMLEAALELGGNKILHVLNLHLGTSYIERRKQAERLLGEESLLRRVNDSPRILLGDFNEWVRGLATRRLSGHMRSAEPTNMESVTEPGQPGKKRMRSYPGILPILHLDHIYYDEELRLRHFYLHRTRLSLMASDHLPLVAEFEFPG